MLLTASWAFCTLCKESCSSGFDVTGSTRVTNDELASCHRLRMLTLAVLPQAGWWMVYRELVAACLREHDVAIGFLSTAFKCDSQGLGDA